MLSTYPKKSIYLDTFSLFAKFFNLSISSPLPIIVYLIFGIFSIKSANAEITVCIPLYCSCLSNLVTESILNLFSLKLFFLPYILQDLQQSSQLYLPMMSYRFSPHPEKYP